MTFWTIRTGYAILDFSVQLLQSSKRGPCHQIRILTTLRLLATYNENLKYEKLYSLAPREFVLKSDSHFASRGAESKGLENDMKGPGRLPVVVPLIALSICRNEMKPLAVDFVSIQKVFVRPVSPVKRATRTGVEVPYAQPRYACDAPECSNRLTWALERLASHILCDVGQDLLFKVGASSQIPKQFGCLTVIALSSADLHNGSTGSPADPLARLRALTVKRRPAGCSG